MSDHGDIQILWSPSQEFSNYVSNVGLPETFIISKCLRFRVRHGIISHEDVGSWWYSNTVISKLLAFQWCIKLSRNLNFCSLYMFKGLRFEMV